MHRFIGPPILGSASRSTMSHRAGGVVWHSSRCRSTRRPGLVVPLVSRRCIGGGHCNPVPRGLAIRTPPRVSYWKRCISFSRASGPLCSACILVGASVLGRPGSATFHRCLCGKRPWAVVGVMSMEVCDQAGRGQALSAGELFEAPTACYIFVDEVSAGSWVVTNTLTRQHRKLDGCVSWEVVDDDDDDGDVILVGIDQAGADKQLMLNEVHCASGGGSVVEVGSIVRSYVVVLCDCLGRVRMLPVGSRHLRWAAGHALHSSCGCGFVVRRFPLLSERVAALFLSIPEMGTQAEGECDCRFGPRR